MQSLFEKHVAENYAITAFALYAACRQFSQNTSEFAGLTLPQALLVPALVFHRKTAESFAKKTRTEGLFYRVVTENIQLIVGLQSRLQDSYDRTMRSIHFGVSTKILFVEKKSSFFVGASIIARPSATFGVKAHSDVQLILRAADRIGYCLANTEFSIVRAALRIEF